MSFSITKDEKEGQDYFALTWKSDWDSFMIKEFLETNFDATCDRVQQKFLIPKAHHSFFVTHLDKMNEKIARETLQVLGRPPKGQDFKKPNYDPTEEQTQQIKKFIPSFQRFKHRSPFCWCFYNDRQSIACDFCRFACCEKAMREEMANPVIRCPEHGQMKLLLDFSV